MSLGDANNVWPVHFLFLRYGDIPVSEMPRSNLQLRGQSNLQLRGKSGIEMWMDVLRSTPASNGAMR
jgi:hypothetical protein